MPHQTTLYINVSMSMIRPSDHSQVGMRMIAPEAMREDGDDRRRSARRR